MMPVQIRTGYDPPVTVRVPGIAIVSSCPSGPIWYIATTVASWGVYPTNHAERASLLVPVLPATGRSSRWAYSPEPRSTTWVMA